MEDIDELNLLDKYITENTGKLNKIVVEQMFSMTKELDKLILEVKEGIKSNSLTDIELEKYLILLSTEIYYQGQTQEYLSLKHQVSKVHYKQKYNSYHKRAEGTQSDKKSYAESKTNLEQLEVSLTESLYQRIKLKLESAFEVMNSIKKVINRRISENELSQNSSSVSYSSYDKPSAVGRSEESKVESKVEPSLRDSNKNKRKIIRDIRYSTKE